MRYNYEYRKKLQVGYIGTGEHSFRNILPAFQYAPIELVALTDHNTQRGLAVARQFGAKRFYPNHKALLAKETELDAIMITVGPDEEGRPRYPELAAESLSAGFNTWVDSPPCLSADQISIFTNACMKRRKYMAVGFRRRFAPAYLRAWELIREPSFGSSSSYTLRFPLRMPDAAQRRTDQGMAAFLPFVDVHDLLTHLFGETEMLSFDRQTDTGGATIQLAHRNGVIGSIHLTAGQSPLGPHERLEIVGQGANLVVDGGVRLSYYRPDTTPLPGLAGRRETYLASGTESAPIVWEPRFESLEPATHHTVLSGYWGSVQSFAERLLAGEPPEHGTLVDVLHVMTVFDRIRSGQERNWIRV